MKTAFRLIIFAAINIVYILVGAAVFMHLEGKHNKKHKEQLYTQYLTDYHHRNISERQVT